MTDEALRQLADAAAVGLDEADAREFVALVEGLDDLLDPILPRDLLVSTDLGEVLDLPPGERLAWARAWDARLRLDELDQQVQEVVERFRDEPTDASVVEEAEALVARLEELDVPADSSLQDRRSVALTDARWVAARGDGPATLRTERRRRRDERYR